MPFCAIVAPYRAARRGRSRWVGGERPRIPSVPRAVPHPRRRRARTPPLSRRHRPASVAPAAPPVVAVVVARDPGDWFEEAIAALAAQDYPNLSILVIDAHSTEPVKPRVAAVAPRRVRPPPRGGPRLRSGRQRGDRGRRRARPSTCSATTTSRPQPDVVRILVEEAFRSNAAVVGPKLVDWDDPQRLLQVGQGMDHAGYGVPLVERGELDQSQHDAVRDVFTVPGPCTLVRADLFTEIGGFDEGISDFLDDVSLCWRAQIAGARVIVAPDARVRNRDELATRVGYDQRRRLQARHRLRIVLCCYRPLGVARAVRADGRPQHGGDRSTPSSPGARKRSRRRRARRGPGTSAGSASCETARKQVREFRHVADGEVRANMHRGSARLSQLLRGQIGRGEDRLTGLARSGQRGGRPDADRATCACPPPCGRRCSSCWSPAAATSSPAGVPEVGQLVSFGDSPVDLLRAWASGWRTAGLGSPSPNPTGLGLIGALGFPVLGAMGLLRTLLILGMLPLGAWFAYRLARPTGSRWAQLACLLVYVAVPLPYNALAHGRWDAVVLYAAAPLLLGMLARASRVAPFGPDGGEAGPGVRSTPWRLRVLAHRLHHRARRPPWPPWPWSSSCSWASASPSVG